MAHYQIAARRDRDAAKALLGEEPGRVTVTDRYAVYLFVDDTQRQQCLAHMARDLPRWASVTALPADSDARWRASSDACSRSCTPTGAVPETSPRCAT